MMTQTAESADRTRAIAFRVMRYAALAFLLIWPWYKGTFVPLAYADLAIVYTIVAASLVMLTGWVGQISLAQAGFVGIGAFVTAMAAESLHLGFPFSTIVSALAAAGAAALMGTVALRVRGLYLAVATLIFSWMCDAYLFLSRWFTKGGGSVSVKNAPTGISGTFPYFDLTNRRTFYFVGLAVAALVIFAVTNLRDSRTGRALFAVKGSEVAAASLGVNVTRYKLLAFSLSGLIAGIAGNLIALYSGSLTPDQFKFTISFFYLAVAVVGGLQSLWGGVAASIVFGAMALLFFEVKALNGYPELVSALLLVVVLLAYPGGLAAVPDSARKYAAKRRARRADIHGGGMREALAAGSRSAPPREATGVSGVSRLLGSIWGRLRRSRPIAVAGNSRLLPLWLLGLDDEHVPVDGAIVQPGSADQTGRSRADTGIALTEPEPGSTTASLPATRRRRVQRGDDRGTPLLEADGITVRFGGLVAVDDVSLAVHEGEIVGLIGPNGAGKTTLFNAIAGLNRPTAGAVRIFGVDATDLPVHERARLGVGRTFQAIQLLTELTVFENLMVATHLQNDTGFLSHIAVTQRALLVEHGCRQLVMRVIDLLGLRAVAHRKEAGLPFGTLRMVEIARALVTRSPLIMLDEPASGLDNAETDKLAQLLFYLREELGVSILLIEHDVELVTSVCDHMYVIDRGRRIAAGPTAEVERDPKVIAAYLGTEPDGVDERSSDRATSTDGPRQPARAGRSSGLVVEAIDVHYGPVQALRGISIEVGEAERVALLGVNGAGKTTTLRTISGLIAPSAGNITFGGRRIAGLAAWDVVRCGITHLPEGRDLFAELSVAENLKLGYWPHRKDKRHLRRRADAVMDLFPILRSRAGQAAGTLSGGEQQMLGMARALMSSPRLLLIDELSLGLAPRIVEQIFEIIAEINNEGTAVLLVEQFVHMALAATDRAYVLARGEVVLEGRSADLLHDPALVASYLGGTSAADGTPVAAETSNGTRTATASSTVSGAQVRQ